MKNLCVIKKMKVVLQGILSWIRVIGGMDWAEGPPLIFSTVENSGVVKKIKVAQEGIRSLFILIGRMDWVIGSKWWAESPPLIFDLINVFACMASHHLDTCRCWLKAHHWSIACACLISRLLFGHVPSAGVKNF